MSDTLSPISPAVPAAKAPQVGFVSLGCPKALTDSELILTRLSAEGYQTSKTFQGADIVIVNTCGFIDEAVQESLDTIGEALAENGRQALEVIKGLVPDFMVLDVAMPEMSGKEFIIELGRQAARDRRLDGIPFVVMTGENFMGSELNRVFASRPGFVCFFPKMIPPDRVLEKAAEILKNRA